MKQITKQLLESVFYYKSCFKGLSHNVASIISMGKNSSINCRANGKTREQAYRNFYRLIGKIEGGE